MKKLIAAFLLVAVVAFAGTTFPAIPFASEAECLAFQADLLARIPHQSGWLPFFPKLLTDGRWVAEIANSLLPDLTTDERSLIVQIDRDLIPPDPWPPTP